MEIIKRHGLWVSLIGHLLFLTGFSFLWLPQWDTDKRPNLYIPSYVASPEQLPKPLIKASEPPLEQPKTEQKPIEQKKPTSKQGIEKPAPAKPQTTTGKTAAPAKQYQTISSPSLAEQGVHLIGDEKIDKDLRTVLGKAISQHLYYPKSAIEFNVRGTVLVGFTLYPDGRVTDVQLVKPSSAGILNVAALAAIRDISPVAGVAEYVQAPRFLVVGIIFG
jgi:TonB family protein